MTTPKVGNLAPVFSLLNQNGEKVSLKDFRGAKNVVVYFYPKASTPGCTTQACGLRDVHAELEQRETIVLGLSPDPVEKLKKFSDKQSLNFDLLSDEEHLIAEKYGVWQLKKFMGREFMGVVRTTFLIDKEGRLITILNKFKTSNHHEVLLQTLDSSFEE
ncbi:thioredoxin-dependent thiol peroxidase [Marinibactrum halimedae]|uniref:thioredoxin-dependent peroxiredoxin n=1 Tax=Marinibactrum halimedae TaxID=1444977 RepID=A0AA37WML8_9GAMM|nr:thioredoxin-dependent thiol peroxidase [Marinibactrum halimedae]MCD9460092.1 thioredoxin-dependent thiol peroxidase [Marinibactrum halimedae]GLS26493.1 peroxiredoxin [Marinibactrum halimedae]